ncbi:MAG: hypothetical protein PVF75_05320 [Granulosicoccaceae bacterium]|jgi:hypothetical protein
MHIFLNTLLLLLFASITSFATAATSTKCELEAVQKLSDARQYVESAQQASTGDDRQQGNIVS